MSFDDKIVDILLKDQTTKKNIIWATSDYRYLGDAYGFNCAILPCHVLSSGSNSIIKPRAEKSKQEQNVRIKDKAEVFTPSWICNLQNNQVDSDWFGRENVFNTEDGRTWHSTENKIMFPEGKTWEQYVGLLRMEITCGEAPYLVSLYDSISGEAIQLKDRIGLLDRKLRIVTENASDDEWQQWTECAYMSTYGYEYQGDSLFLARGNLLKTYIEYYENKFDEEPAYEKLTKIAEIISWNIWQMDGIKGIVPYKIEYEEEGGQMSMLADEGSQLSLFSESLAGDSSAAKEKAKRCADLLKFSETYCKIMDWQENKAVSYVSLIRTMR